MKKMECPKCKGDDTLLIYTNKQLHSTIKGYKCRECGNSWKVQFGLKDDPNFRSEPLSTEEWF